MFLDIQEENLYLKKRIQELEKLVGQHKPTPQGTCEGSIAIKVLCRPITF